VGGQKANDHGSQDVARESELDLELDDFYFEPTVLTGSAGETLTLDLETRATPSTTSASPIRGSTRMWRPERRPR
jgi:hypothetical protein